MLGHIAFKLEQFILRLLNGEPLAFFQLILFVTIAFFAQRIWQGISKSPFFKIMMAIVFCLLAFGFLLMPNQMMDVFGQFMGTLAKPSNGN